MGNGWHHLLLVYSPDLYWHSSDVLLPPFKGPGLPRHPLSGSRRAVREAAAQHAPVGSAFDGHNNLAPHVQGCPYGELQDSARVQLDGRGSSAGADASAEFHGLFAARRPVRLLGSDSRHQYGSGNSFFGERGPVWAATGNEPVQ